MKPSILHACDARALICVVWKIIKHKSLFIFQKHVFTSLFYVAAVCPRPWSSSVKLHPCLIPWLNMYIRNRKPEASVPHSQWCISYSPISEHVSESMTNFRNDLFQQNISVYLQKFLNDLFLIIYSKFVTSPIFAKCIHFPLCSFNLRSFASFIVFYCIVFKYLYSAPQQP